MTEELIVTGYFGVSDGSLCGNVVVGNGLAVKLERSCHNPTLIVEEELMNANLMTFALVGEA